MFFEINTDSFDRVNEERKFHLLSKITCLKNGKTIFVYYDLETKLITYRFEDKSFASGEYKKIEETIIYILNLSEKTRFCLTRVFFKKGKKKNSRKISNMDWEYIFQKHVFVNFEFLYY